MYKSLSLSLSLFVIKKIQSRYSITEIIIYKLDEEYSI